MWTTVLAVHAAATWYLVGLIWTIQIVHYPSFPDIDPAHYAAFQSTHMTRMGGVVGLAWLIEGISVLGVFLLAPDLASRVLAGVGGLLEAVVLAVTIRASIPAHEALLEGFDVGAHRRLLITNWWRTIAWSARGAIAVALLLIA